jgi:phenylacetate-CoA ligase
MKKARSRLNMWEDSPRWFKRIVGAGISVFPPSLILGTPFRRNLKFVDKAQWWSAEQCADYQLQRVRDTCANAYANTAYYRETFEEAGVAPESIRSLEDLRRLPRINKDTLRCNLERMCAVSPDQPGIDYVSTGGSHGEPLRFYIGAERSSVEYAYLVNSWRSVGYDLRVPQCVFRGRIVEPDRLGLRHEYDPLLRRHYYSNFHMSDNDVTRYLSHVSRLGPCYLHVYPSSAFALATIAERRGLSIPKNVKGVLAGSENVYSEERECVERVFGCRYFSWYGHSEKLVFAAECEHSADYHISPTYGYCELLDDDGEPVTEPGKRGEIVGTGFINRIVPFIRYRTGDYATLGGFSCDACGRHLMIVTDIKGRWPQGCLVALDGAMISMTAVNMHDDTLEGVRSYQFYQRDRGTATLRVVPSRTLSSDERAKIITRLNDRLQGQVVLTLEVLSELPKTKRGKQLRVIQDVAGAPKDGERS